MSPCQVTGSVIVFLILVVSAYDLFALFYWGPGATISNVVRRWDDLWPLLGYLVCFGGGMLVWHFFSR